MLEQQHVIDDLSLVCCHSFLARMSPQEAESRVGIRVGVGSDSPASGTRSPVISRKQPQLG